MKRSIRSLLCTLALALTLAPAVCLADYQTAERAVEKLENCVNLTPAQQAQARQIFQNLKDVMDDLSPADRPLKGAQSRHDALVAIRNILTPAQQAIYDRTPQRLGGGMTGPDPAMSALRLKISTFVRTAAQNSSEIATGVGSIQKVVVAAGGATETDFREPADGPVIGDTRAALMQAQVSTTDGAQSAKYEDPMLHPTSGTNIVRVTGSTATQVYRISWNMDPDGAMKVTKIELVNP